MTFTSRILATIVSTIILPLALVLFASGFFPYKPFLPGLATFGEDGNGSRPPPVFDRVILLVVDALRRYYLSHQKSGLRPGSNYKPAILSIRTIPVSNSPKG
jgi:ethanolaminephosphotransferase